MPTKLKIPDHYVHAINKRIDKVAELCDEIYSFISENGCETIDFKTNKVLIFVGSHKAMAAAERLRKLRRKKYERNIVDIGPENIEGILGKTEREGYRENPRDGRYPEDDFPGRTGAI